jgi:hypothetical protein
MPRLTLSGRVLVKATAENSAIHTDDLLASSSKNRLCGRLLISTLAIVSVVSASAGAQSAGGPYRIKSAVIAGGGGSVDGGAYRSSGTFSQSATATLSASGYQFYAGFWAPASGSMPTDLIFANGLDP